MAGTEEEVVRMRAFGRSLLGVLAGTIVAVVLISGLEVLEHRMYPLPAGVSLDDREALQRFVENLPVGAFLMLLFGWGVGTFAGAWVTARVAGRAPIAHGMVIGVLFLLGGILNMVAIPHPAWVWGLAFVILLGSGYAGGRLQSR